MRGRLLLFHQMLERHYYLTTQARPHPLHHHRQLTSGCTVKLGMRERLNERLNKKLNSFSSLKFPTMSNTLGDR